MLVGTAADYTQKPKVIISPFFMHEFWERFKRIEIVINVYFVLMIKNMMRNMQIKSLVYYFLKNQVAKINQILLI